MSIRTNPADFEKLIKGLSSDEIISAAIECGLLENKDINEGDEVTIPRWLAEDRGALLAALLTMARAWVGAGRPNGCKKIVGGFDEWVEIVGGILAHAGISGFLDNLSKLYEEVDIGNDEWADFFKTWHDSHNDKGLTSAEVLDDLRNPYTFLAKCAPSELAEKIKYPGPGDAKKVGLALRKKLNVRYKNGLMLAQGENADAKIKLWKVVKVKDHAVA